MSNAPVSTASFPDAGSEAYVGLANAMELAMDELSTIFPEMLRGETKSSNPSKSTTTTTETSNLWVLFPNCDVEGECKESIYEIDSKCLRSVVEREVGN